MRQFAVLAWKEWREGWTTVVGVWVLAAVAWFLAPVCGDPLVSLLTLIALTGAGVLGGRSFADEAEAKTNRFLTAQPVSLDTIWIVKFAFASVALAVFYLAWYAGAARGLWIRPMRAFDATIPTLVLLPPVAFALALLLSTAVDNTILACVGGVVGGFAHILPVLILAPADPDTLARNPAADTVALCTVLIAAPLYIVASRYVFRLRARR